MESGVKHQRIRDTRPWSARQWQVIEGFLMELRHAEQQRQHWRSLIAQEVLADPHLLSIVRLCGVREMVAFALGALIGDIQRFASSKKLVKYVGLNPAFDDSGNGHWTGGIGGHGRKDLRCLLIEAAHSILRCSQTDLASWGKKLLARKGEINLVVAAIACKLTVAVWYLMMGHWTPVEEIDDRLAIKVSKIIMYITEGGISLHGTYWHNDFGRPKSHGCINLTPQAAKWLYRWTMPTVAPDKELAYGHVGTKVEIKL